MTSSERQDWVRFRSDGDVEARNRLVERHLPLVHHFAGRMLPQASGEMEAGELVSAGVLGLMEAVAGYDPDRGFRFSTFAATRIRGAMLDEMRRRDTVPRSVRRNQRRMRKAQGRLTVDLDRSPAHPELARVLGVDVKTLWRWKWDAVRSRTVSLSQVEAGASGERPLVDVVLRGGADEDDLEERLTRQAEVQRLLRELEGLEERDRLVVRLYDLEGWTLREVGRRLGVSESRVSQLRSRALGRLRSRMSDLRVAA